MPGQQEGVEAALVASLGRVLVDMSVHLTRFGTVFEGIWHINGKDSGV